jgi:hypothetical protein
VCEHWCQLGEDWHHHFSASEHQNPAGNDPPEGVLLCSKRPDPPGCEAQGGPGLVICPERRKVGTWS